MSIAINPVHNASASRLGAVSVVPPAEIWDLDSVPKRRSGGAGVRTISASHRTSARSVSNRVSGGSTEADTFETRHETRDTLLLGVCMTAALLIGSAFGGVFSAQDKDPSSMTASQVAHAATVATAR